MPQPTKPQLAIYAAFAIAVLLIGARFLRSNDGGDGGSGVGSGLASSSGGHDSGDSSDDFGWSGGSLDASGSGADTGSSGGSLDGAGSAAAGSLDAGGTGGEGSGDGLGEGAGEAAAVAGAGGASEIVVDVKGAVRRAGVYRLAPGSRALDAVRKAGGMTHAADRLGVNLAAPVTDGGEVVVPRRGAAGMNAAGGVSAAGAAAATGATSGATGSPDSASGQPATPLSIDINTASEQELEELDGVGPATAAKILEYRQLHGGFKSIDELDEVSGIGEAKLAAIRAQLGR